jgi:hypothetical protein
MLAALPGAHERLVAHTLRILNDEDVVHPGLFVSAGLPPRAWLRN